jgi:molecular chaperone GrpE
MPDDRETPENSSDYDQDRIDDAPSGSSMEDTKNTSVEDELKAAQERYLRLAAEFENYKKRAQKDQDEYRRYSNERLVKELLPVLDNLHRALQHGRQSGNLEGILQGVELTYKQYQEILSRFGVKPIPTVGLPFDPTIHQAVATVEAKGRKPNTVVEEYEKGYYLNDRVLRPAMVTVAGSGNPERTESDS